ncbi:hypothetical protein WJX74_001449 [Apatococcus lobatus]|uniref:alpha-glucosidase n=1 Tax=Apatococcus lobatus TaxID=904363 RepID=A0AAW1S5H8_9CHLO
MRPPVVAALFLALSAGPAATETQKPSLGSYKIVERQSSESPLEAKLEIQQGVEPKLGEDINPLSLLVNATRPDTLHFKLSPTVQGRWEIPATLFKRPTGSEGAGDKLLEYSIDDNPFSVSIHRTGQASGDALFSTNNTQLIFKDQYMEVTSWIPEEASLYGAGEFTPSEGFRLERDGTPIALWNQDQQAKAPNLNLYGARPFILSVLPDGSASGVLLLNSNGMDILPEKDRVTWKVIGGVLDFYVFAGPTPAAVVHQLTEVIGRPHLPPYWSLGFHNCKWGYKTVEEAEEVVRNYSRAGIPLDTMWLDIDYMDGNRDFSLDPVRFAEPKMKAFLDRLHAANQSWVPIIDAGIKVDHGYPAYDDGIASNVFVKDATGAPYIGQVWPGATHWPDFGHKRTVSWWQRQIAAAHELSPFDGLWIDMDEVSNFCTGEVCELAPPGPSMTECYLPCHDKQAPSNGSLKSLGDWWPSAKVNASLRDPPYAIHNGGAARNPLDTKTMPVTASNLDGTLQYDTHNVYGLQEAKATYEALVAIKQTRPFILTRSTFLGSGACAAHWTGDNAATWDDLRWSIPGVFQSGVNGIPFVGPDICGFLGNTTEELCARWISVGAFYPFSRDHSDINGGYQELYRWEAVADAARTALGLRYRMLPTLYTIFKHSHDTGVPIARPLFFGWPHDPVTHTTDQQFMLGDSILISPVLHEGVENVKAYFPQGKWYSAFDHSEVDASGGGQHVVLDAPLGAIPVHILEGAILPVGPQGTTTPEVRTGALLLLIALNKTTLADTACAARHEIASSRRLLQHQLAAGDMDQTQKKAGSKPAAPASCGTQRHARPAVHDRRCHIPEGSLGYACGSMFLDDGSQLEVDGAEGHVIQFAASLVREDADGLLHGVINMTLGEGTAACADVAWPILESVTILGHPDAHLQAIHLSTTAPSVLSSNGINMTQASVHPTSGAITITGLGIQMTCPSSAALTWTAA